MLRVLVIITAIMHSGVIRATPGPFNGEIQETWESFTHTSGEQPPLPAPQQIFGGMAAIFGNSMHVFRPASGYPWDLGSSGYAQVADGTNAMAISGSNSVAVIVFSIPVAKFGSYWGAYTSSSANPASVDVQFFDTAGMLISSESFTYSRAPVADGLLEWHGWHSSVPIKRVIYPGDGVTTDGLRASLTPEPATIMLLALLLATYRRRRVNVESSR